MKESSKDFATAHLFFSDVSAKERAANDKKYHLGRYQKASRKKKWHQRASQKGKKKARREATDAQILKYSDGRYFVANQKGGLLDNAGGWGFKTVASAKCSKAYQKYRSKRKRG